MSLILLGLSRGPSIRSWRTLQCLVSEASSQHLAQHQAESNICRIPENTCQDPGQAASSSHRVAQARCFSSQARGKEWSQRRLVGWSPDQFYQVVSDVEQYRHFVPWCQASRVMTRSPDGTKMTAELAVGFQMLKERYTSHVTLQPPHKVSSQVRDSLLFHHLDSSWRMEPGPSPRTCWLTFSVDFAFNSALYGHMADLFFSEVVKQMVTAFEGRAHKMYGPSSLVRPTSGSGSSGSSSSSSRSALHK
eukprot:CAMPEP_0202860522 /NCGR_PEP_ID=MMETSP1391-20130828/2191_1 /ASSEMBLY_ACC=CAM_ASM_000867 /TAXON_ID=1034604 /ORGANISM="Chlamydomonas leiostraca, Strain SAG 11-49" /LENGTH=247 /DNA_ID=CAMNT_0049539693 /DNA_START=8 /DNA_END=751 /DNA_ORIENTATION=-